MEAEDAGLKIEKLEKTLCRCPLDAQGVPGTETLGKSTAQTAKGSRCDRCGGSR